MKRIMLVALLVSTLLPLTALTAAEPVYACGNSAASQQVITGVNQTGGSTPGHCGQDSIDSVISTAVTILTTVVGIVAVIAIILSGFKYITSGGDSAKVANAKNTLIYALVGIAVAVLAQALVNLTIDQSNQAANACPSGQHRDAAHNCVPN